MKWKSWSLMPVIGLFALIAQATAIRAATFGAVVPIGGHASDLALDERRGLLYIANFTANRIEVMSLENRSISTSMNVAAQPGSLSLSPDGRYLLVSHFGNFSSPSSRTSALTLIDLETRGRQTFALSSPPLCVAFGINGLALIATTTDFTLFDPVSGVTRSLATFEELAATSLPAPPASFPPNIVAASMGVSGDGNRIYGLTDTFEFGFDVTSGRLSILSYTSEPPQGPRVVSVNKDGSRYLSGWVLHGTAIWDWATGVWNLAQFPDAEGLLNVGSHALDASRGLVYAQFTKQKVEGQVQDTTPVLQILDSESLAVRERIWLPENLAGKSVLNSDGSIMYSASDSGVMVLPVGYLDRVPRIKSSAESLHFQGTVCNRRFMTKEITISDPSGARTDFSLSANTAGVEATPQRGTTPATIIVRVDPNAFQNKKGTSAAEIKITSGGAINDPKAIRVLLNNPDPDQRGTTVSVPGKLVDILADPFRDRVFILRQDTNEVLVFDTQSNYQIASLRTGNTPTQMAITFDRRYLLVGHNNAQFIAVFDLETLQPSLPHIRTPGGHYPRSIATSGRAILSANRVAGPVHTIDRVDLATRTATELPSLGVYQNDIDVSTVLIGSPNGSSILIAEKDGNVMLYNANVDTFTISRKDTGKDETLKGAYAASSYDQFVVGNRLMNASLVTTAFLETGTGQSSGFAFVEQMGFRTTSPSTSDPGVIQRVETQSGKGIRATRMLEAPLLGTEDYPFTRTLAPLYNRKSLVSLTTSGYTVVPWDYDASVAPPRIASVVNGADFTAPVAPGGLVTILGEQLSPTNEASRQVPLPTALGGSCLTVNGVAMPVLFVSSNQVNAQLPFTVEGNVTLVLKTPGGVSDNYNLTISPTAPSVFRSTAGSVSEVPTLVRYGNGQLVTLANPIHPEDDLVIYLTGLGRTDPPIESGEPGPANPPATALTPVEVHLAGAGLQVSYAGMAPGMVGVYQINAKVPWWVPAGMQQPLTIAQGGGSTTLSVRVVK